jgi:hypothetical protein
VEKVRGLFPLTSILSLGGERIEVRVFTGDCFVTSFLAMTTLVKVRCHIKIPLFPPCTDRTHR